MRTVALQDGRELPPRERIEAEVRFARKLERVLGAEEYAVQSSKAWIEVSESEASQIDRSTAISAARWPVAGGRERRTVPVGRQLLRE